MRKDDQPLWHDNRSRRTTRTCPLAITLILILLCSQGGPAQAGSHRFTDDGTPLPALPTATPITMANDTPALAYYYIWFNQDSWDHEKIDFPSLGRYSSDDGDVMRQHIQWAKSVGIDGFIVSWKHTDVWTSRLRTLVQVSNEEGFKLSIIYEALDGERNPFPAAQIASDFDFFINEFGGNQAFDLFGKPLVIWFATWEFSREDIASVTTDRRDELLILASDRNPDDYRNHAGLFDGNAYYWSSVDPNTHEGYEDKLTAMGTAAREQGGLWIAPAAPGFDDRLLGGERAVSRENGEMLRTQLAAAYQSQPDAIGIISWNEFSENSHVEPSCLYGVQALEVLASILGGDAPASVPCGAGTDDDVGMVSNPTASAG